MTVPAKSCGLVGAAVFAVAGATATAGVEEAIDLAGLPAGIIEIARDNLAGLRLAVAKAPETIDDGSEIDDNLVLSYQALGAVSLAGANTETEADGSFVYEIQGTTDDGRKVEIDIAPDGQVQEIEIEFTREDVPGAVLMAVARKLPDFVPRFIEASHSPSLQVIGYEFVGTLGEAQLDIEVSADGRHIAVSDQ
ncbi:hypothetical protein [Microbulbifer sp. S227A]|uniref:hypothetical protein n=1 Tax=Microbulbifer sp. S227A TaxID=3415131 RepID=UPI003C798D08